MRAAPAAAYANPGRVNNPVAAGLLLPRGRPVAEGQRRSPWPGVCMVEWGIIRREHGDESKNLNLQYPWARFKARGNKNRVQGNMWFVSL